MNTRLIAAVILGSFVLAGCGGGGSNVTEDETRLTVEEERIAELEEQLEEAREEAEQERLAREAEELAKQEAQAEQERLEMEAESARQAANAAEAARVYTGLGEAIGSTLAASPRYGAAADITTPANVRSSSAGSMGRWFKTTGSNRSQTAADRVEVYSDVEAPTSIPFKDSMYNQEDPVVNEQGMVDPEGYDLGDDLRMDVASSSFDRTSAQAKSFDIVDRGFLDQAAKDTAITDCNTEEACLARVRNIPVRNINRHPYRWSAEAGGALGGASGRFRCGETGEASTSSTSCTVQNTGGGFVFDGPWSFVPSSGTVGVRVQDSQYMWFGWWSRETLPGGAFSFDTDHGGTSPNMTGVTGTATYNGIAVGRYAISGTLVANQGHGEFSADAQLIANFDDNAVVGTLSRFTGQPNWEVTLRGGTISGAAVTGAEDGVTWSIGGDAKDGGEWEADFYSNLPTAESTGVQPYGIAGTFQAEHGDAARMIGAFGAHM